MTQIFQRIPQVFTNDRGSHRVFLEGAETLAYTWSSAPITGTELSQLLLVNEREFQFPIDYTNMSHLTWKKIKYANLWII